MKVVVVEGSPGWNGEMRPHLEGPERDLLGLRSLLNSSREVHPDILSADVLFVRLTPWLRAGANNARITSACKKAGVPLVLFSGGTSGMRVCSVPTEQDCSPMGPGDGEELVEACLFGELKNQLLLVEEDYLVAHGGEFLSALSLRDYKLLSTDGFRSGRFIALTSEELKNFSLDR